MSPLSDDARRWLLAVARRAIVAAILGEAPAGPQIPPELPECDRQRLAQPHSIFVSLHKHGKLRGCVGHLALDAPLYVLAAGTAAAAALDDLRFPPVVAEEIGDLDVEISVLSPFFPARLEDIVPGKHGLLVYQGEQRGLLLPQVASERKWDAARFLRETCRKAGLPADAWKKGASVEAFTAEVFAEPERKAEAPDSAA